MTTARVQLPALDPRLAKALSHPLRQQLLSEYSEAEASPSELAAKLDARLGDVSYHTKRLLEHGCIDLIRTETGNGGTKHFYRATVRYEVGDAAWSELEDADRARVAAPVVEQIVAELQQAAAQDALSRDGIHVSRLPLRLSDRGRERLSALLLELVHDAERLSAEEADDGGDPSLLALLHIPRPGGSAP